MRGRVVLATARAAHLDAVADVVQNVVVYGLPDVPDRPLHVSGRDDLVGPGRVLVCGEDADFPPGHLLFVDVHRLGEGEGKQDFRRTLGITLRASATYRAFNSAPITRHAPLLSFLPPRQHWIRKKRGEQIAMHYLCCVAFH